MVPTFFITPEMYSNSLICNLFLATTLYSQYIQNKHRRALS